MDMDKDMGSKEVLHAGRAPADATCDIGEVQGRDGAEVAAVGVELAAHSPSKLHFLPGPCVLPPSLLVISHGRIGPPFA